MGKIRVKKLDPRATIPKRGSAGATGFDLYPIERAYLYPNTHTVIRTGIAVQLEKGTHGRIAPLSGYPFFYRIEVGACVINCDYTGEILVKLISTEKKLFFNDGGNPQLRSLVYEECDIFYISPDEPIAQLIIERIDMSDVVEEEKVPNDKDLEETERVDAAAALRPENDGFCICFLICVAVLLMFFDKILGRPIMF